MNHPPVPPNCDWFDTLGSPAFKKMDGGEYIIFILLDWPANTPQLAIEGYQRDLEIWRPVIAAVAEVAWLREAERLDKVMQQTNDDVLQEYSHAVLTSQEWAAWGRGEQGK